MANPSFEDTADFENIDRGFIDTLAPCIVKSKQGAVVWNNEDFTFLRGRRPDTVNAKLWRQSQLCLRHGLFKVAEGIYQVRGIDLSNISFIEGDSGVIVMDPLVSIECAQAAFSLYRKNRGNRPVKAVIYTHSHIDHFGGAAGVVPESGGEQERLPIIAPENFIEEALSENVFAGPSMRRRAVFMYGTSLPPGPEGLVSCGLGLTTSKGTTSLIPPNDIIYTTGEERTIDGVRIVFQMVPESEAPSEFNLFFPDRKALCISECATHCLHNIITLRGALVRDAKRWSKYLDETIALYGKRTDVLFSGHHWPTWGQSKVEELISQQRDLYAYMHDQTVRLMNQGLTGIEIAEMFQLPQALQQRWHTQGYYGSISHNVKGIYQRYMTWFDGNPANLWKHTPAEEGKRYVACMGGVEATIAKAKKFAAEGDLRFAATLLDHAAAAEPNNTAARSNLADVYEQLGYGSENATWRNFYLTGAAAMRKPATNRSSGPVQRSGRSLASISPQSSIENWLDALAVQLDGWKAGSRSLNYLIDIKVPEEKVLGGENFRPSQSDEKGNLEITLTKADLFQLLTQGSTGKAEKTAAGDMVALKDVLGLCDIAESPGERSKM